MAEQGRRRGTGGFWKQNVFHIYVTFKNIKLLLNKHKRKVGFYLLVSLVLADFFFLFSLYLPFTQTHKTEISGQKLDCFEGCCSLGSGGVAQNSCVVYIHNCHWLSSWGGAVRGGSFLLPRFCSSSPFPRLAAYSTKDIKQHTMSTYTDFCYYQSIQKEIRYKLD